MRQHDTRTQLLLLVIAALLAYIATDTHEFKKDVKAMLATHESRIDSLEQRLNTP